MIVIAAGALERNGLAAEGDGAGYLAGQHRDDVAREPASRAADHDGRQRPACVRIERQLAVELRPVVFRAQPQSDVVLEPIETHLVLADVEIRRAIDRGLLVHLRA